MKKNKMMKTTIYKSIFLTAIASSLVLSVNAQKATEKDTTLNRQVMLERDYTPTLQDASKINTLPAIHESVIKTSDVQFESRQPNLSFINYPLGDTGSGDIKTDVDFSKKKGYLNMAAGNYLNMKGAFGYKFIDTKSDQLDLFVRHNSTNGKLKYEDDKYYSGKVKAEYMNNLVMANYQHSFEYLKWFFNANFENTSFNYYGNPFDSAINFDIDKKQTVNSFGAETGVVSNDKNEFIYTGSVSFNHFTTKYGSFAESDGVTGNVMDAKFDIAAPFQGDKLIGVRLGVSHNNYSDLDPLMSGSGGTKFHSLTKLQFNPYFRLDGDNYKVSLGINANYAMDKKSKFLISPDIKASLQFADKTSLYLNAVGGINDNNYLDIMRENRYVSQWNKVNYSRTLLDAVIGIKSGIINGLEFDVFAGYKYTKDEHLYVNYIYSSVSSLFGNSMSAEYYDLGVGHAGLQLKTSLIPYTTLSAKTVAYFYSIDGKLDNGSAKNKAWNLPTFTLNINADVNPIDNLTISANYNLASGRKMCYNGVNVLKMENINELNFRGEYRLTEWLSVNAQANNVLNQKYETWYGYTHQGINVMGGVSIKF